ncbi:amidohydrolase family protein [Pelagibius sp. Alg239-R121]|uniref:amidohydrolase family protein n=1 Tax=Pelagibius sp. Alg239-R121 TaxID=2993448 RepID=UPI0024A71D4A|nr:amidohydrolase family protein [Pelagibius sp. Alg239-R121]
MSQSEALEGAGKSARILIRNATILSMDTAVGNFQRASILVEGDQIMAVGLGTAPDIEFGSTQVIDAEGMIALPGFIDAHRHVWQSPLSMAAADADLNSYFAAVPGKLAPVYEADDLRTANHIGALQALNAGVTTIFDWCHVLHSPAHADAAIEGLLDSGIRAIFGYGFPNTETAWSMDSERPVPNDIRRVRRERLTSDDALVTMAMAARGPEQSTIEVTKHDMGVARDLDLLISLHAGNGAFGLPYRSVERMYEEELLGADVQYVHCNSLTDESIQRIADSGGRMVSTPAIEMQMQFGYPASTRFLAAGIRPGLGADVVTSTGCSLFPQMASAFQAARLQELEQGTPEISTYDVLSFATVDGAESVGLASKTGSLTPGKQADIVLLRPPALTVMNDPIGFTVLGASTDCVDTVVVAGEIKKRDGALCGIEAGQLQMTLESCRDRLFERSGFQPPSSSFR